MKILVTGANGLLGSNLEYYMQASSRYDVVGTSLNIPETGLNRHYVAGDLAEPGFAQRLMEKLRPDVVINTVALVDLNRCEAEPELAERVNIDSAARVAEAAEAVGARLIHISTDHLFDGHRSFYSEDDQPSPVNSYGRTKLAAESVCLENHADTVVVRTNFYGWCRGPYRPNFGSWIHDSLRDGLPIKLFTDYYFSPIEVGYLARALETVAASDYTGVLNVCGRERVSKYDFGVAVAKAFGYSFTNVTPTQLDPAAFAVPRPADLSLNVERFRRLFGDLLPDLNEGVAAFLRSRPEMVK